MVDALPPFHNITFSAKNLNTDISLRSEILVLSPESYRKNFSIDFSLGLLIEGHKTAKTKYVLAAYHKRLENLSNIFYNILKEFRCAWSISAI